MGDGGGDTDGTMALRTSRRRVLYRACAVALSVVVALGLVEAGLRVHHASAGTYDPSDEALRARSESLWTASDDPELVYVHRPRHAIDGARLTEAHGILRPHDVITPKPPGVRRVAVLGDSVGAATYVAYDRRFAARIERRLSATVADDVEVLNLCVDGYDTLQEARLLETVGAALEPDAVLVVYCLNDASECTTPLRWFRAPVPPTSFALDAVLDAIVGPRGRPVAMGGGPASGAAPFWKRAYARDDAGWAVVTEGLDRIASWCRAHDVPALVAVAPLLLRDDPEGSSTAAYRAQVADALDARGLPCVDLQDVVTETSLPRLIHDPTDIYHFSAEGHAVLSDALHPHVAGLLRNAR